MRRTYSRRESDLVGQDRYSLTNKAYLYTIQQRQRAMIRLLQQESMMPLSGKTILEIGSGAGGVLLELLTLGASPDRLHGTDLLAERVAVARRLLPQVAMTVERRPLFALSQNVHLIFSYNSRCFHR